MEPIIRDFKPDDAEELSAMVEHTVEESYKWVYPDPVRQLFKKENTPERITEMANIGCVLVAVDPEMYDELRLLREASNKKKLGFTMEN